MTTQAVTWVVMLASVLGFQSATIAQDGLDALLERANPQQPGATEAERRLAVPPATALKQAISDIKEIFKDDYSKATSPQARSTFSRQLLSQAEKTPTPVERWALLSEAMRLASDAGDLDLSFEAITKAAAHFSIDTDELQLEAVTKVAAKAPPQSLDDLARAGLTIAQKAAAAGNSAVAAKSLAVALSLARKTKNRTLLAEATRIQQTVRDREKESREQATVEAKLAAHPGDAEVCLEAGKYFCFKAEDWPRGLPLLAKCSDTDLARLAVAEINAGKSANAVMSLADAWWDWAQKERGNDKAAGLAHAATLYETVLAQTAGLDRARLEKRIQESQRAGNGRQERRSFIADLKEDATKNVVGAFTKNGTYEGAAFMCGNRAWPKSLVFVAYEKSPSVTFTIPEGARRLVGKVGIFTPATGVNASIQPQEQQFFEILLDGKTAWKSPALSKRDETADFDVPLFDAQRVELRVTSKSVVYSWPAWLDPEFIY